jgi:hypothetical protein
MSMSAADAVSEISQVASQLRAGGVTPQREAQLEQQLVQAISGANASANWGMIATIADDIADPTLSSSAVNVDITALDRMVQPTDAANLSTVIGTLAQQLRDQSPYPAGTSALAATASAGVSAITLPSTTGMFDGDPIQITLDDGATFSTTIATLFNNVVNLAKPLPSQASSGNRFVDTALQQSADASAGGSASKSIVTSLTGVALSGASTVKVKSATGMLDGDPVQLQLSDGSTLDTTITSITGSTTLTSDALSNATAVTVGSTAGMSDGDAVQIKLDSGTTFNTIIASIAGNTVSLAAPLPSQASTGTTFTDPTDVTIGLATTLPVGATDGAGFTDTANVPASSDPISIVSPLTAAAAAGATTLSLASVGAMALGDTVQIQLNNGTVFNTSLANVDSVANTVTLAAPLPSAAAINKTVTDMVSTPAQSSSFTPAVTLSPQMLAMLQLQLDVLVGAANPSADTTTLQTTLSGLVSSTLTTPQFQQDVTALVQLAQQGITPGTSLSILA